MQIKLSLFTQGRFCTQPRFEKEDCWNSEMVHIRFSPSFLLFKQKDYILISANCDKEFWSLSSDSLTAWLHYTQAFSV